MNIPYTFIIFSILHVILWLILLLINEDIQEISNWALFGVGLLFVLLSVLFSIKDDGTYSYYLSLAGNLMFVIIFGIVLFDGSFGVPLERPGLIALFLIDLCFSLFLASSCVKYSAHTQTTSDGRASEESLTTSETSERSSDQETPTK